MVNIQEQQYLEKHFIYAKDLLREVAYPYSRYDFIKGYWGLTIRWNKEETRKLGRCNYQSKVIDISYKFYKYNSENNNELINIIMHELIHAYLGSLMHYSPIPSSCVDSSPVFHSIINWFNFQFNKKNLGFKIVENGFEEIYSQYHRKEGCFLHSVNLCNDLDGVMDILMEYLRILYERVEKFNNENDKKYVQIAWDDAETEETSYKYTVYKYGEKIGCYSGITLSMKTTIEELDGYLECFEILNEVDIANEMDVIVVDENWNRYFK